MIKRGSKVEWNGETYVVEWVSGGFLGGLYLNLSVEGDGFPVHFDVPVDEVTEV